MSGRQRLIRRWLQEAGILWQQPVAFYKGRSGGWLGHWRFGCVDAYWGLDWRGRRAWYLINPRHGFREPGEINRGFVLSGAQTTYLSLVRAATDPEPEDLPDFPAFFQSNFPDCVYYRQEGGEYFFRLSPGMERYAVVLGPLSVSWVLPQEESLLIFLRMLERVDGDLVRHGIDEEWTTERSRVWADLLLGQGACCHLHSLRSSSWVELPSGQVLEWVNRDQITFNGCHWDIESYLALELSDYFAREQGVGLRVTGPDLELWLPGVIPKEVWVNGRRASPHAVLSSYLDQLILARYRNQCYPVTTIGKEQGLWVGYPDYYLEYFHEQNQWWLVKKGKAMPLPNHYVHLVVAQYQAKQLVTRNWVRCHEILYRQPFCGDHYRLLWELLLTLWQQEGYRVEVRQGENLRWQGLWQPAWFWSEGNWVPPEVIYYQRRGSRPFLWAQTWEQEKLAALISVHLDEGYDSPFSIQTNPDLCYLSYRQNGLFLGLDRTGPQPLLIAVFYQPHAIPLFSQLSWPVQEHYLGFPTKQLEETFQKDFRTTCEPPISPVALKGSWWAAALPKPPGAY